MSKAGQSAGTCVVPCHRSPSPRRPHSVDPPLTLDFHEGIEGNERADELAKQATEEGSSPNRRLPVFIRRKGLPASISATRQVMKSDIKKRWKTEWEVSPRQVILSNVDCSMPSDDFMHIVSQLNRRQASVLIQLRTGHLPLNNVLFRIKRADTPACPHCNNGTRETMIHFLFFCPHYEIARDRLNNATRREKKPISFLLGKRKGIPHLLHYVHNTERLKSTFGNIRPPPDFVIHNKKSKDDRMQIQQPPPPDTT